MITQNKKYLEKLRTIRTENLTSRQRKRFNDLLIEEYQEFLAQVKEAEKTQEQRERDDRFEKEQRCQKILGISLDQALEQGYCLSDFSAE